MHALHTLVMLGLNGKASKILARKALIRLCLAGLRIRTSLRPCSRKLMTTGSGTLRTMPSALWGGTRVTLTQTTFDMVVSTKIRMFRKFSVLHQILLEQDLNASFCTIVLSKS